MLVGTFPPADSVESKIYGFDFKRGLVIGEEITGADFDIFVIDGTDSGAASHLIGPAVISGTQARQRVAGLVQGVTYVLQATVSTNQGSVKSLWGRVECLF
jgi:hypothetical protein